MPIAKTYSQKLQDPRWQKKRLEILNRDEFMCAACADTEETLHIHHICYQGDNPWDTEDRFLQTLCATCHKEEGELLKTASYNLIKSLKMCGFTSMGLDELADVFKDIPDRGWTYDDRAFSILKIAISSNEVWSYCQSLHDQAIDEKIRIRKEAESLIVDQTDPF